MKPTVRRLRRDVGDKYRRYFFCVGDKIRFYGVGANVGDICRQLCTVGSPGRHAKSSAVWNFRRSDEKTPADGARRPFVRSIATRNQISAAVHDADSVIVTSRRT